MTDDSTPQAEPEANPDPGPEGGDTAPVRDDRGRFLPGNPGSPGRKPQATEAEYHRATMKGCTVEDWERIVSRAVKDCESPKVAERNAARSFLLRALFGQAPGALVQIANLSQDPDPLGTARRLLQALGDFAAAEHPEHAASVAAILAPFGERLVKAGGRVEDLTAAERPKGLSPMAIESLRAAILGAYGVNIAPQAAESGGSGVHVYLPDNQRDGPHAAANLPKARGLSKEDARFWRQGVLMGEPLSEAAPEPEGHPEARGALHPGEQTPEGGDHGGPD